MISLTVLLHEVEIVKLPDPEHPGLAENEYAVMSWARESAIDIPDFDIVTRASLVDLPDLPLLPDGELCVAIRRFDRPQSGVRVHVEDFAQVNDIHPLFKYDEHRPIAERLNYETLANQVLTFCGGRILDTFTPHAGLPFSLEARYALDRHHKRLRAVPGGLLA